MANKSQERAAREHYRQYQQSSDYRLSDVYGRYSTAKEKAFDYCKEMQDKLDGSGLKIITHSIYQFTAGFTYTDPVTGKYMFYYIAPTFDCAVEV